MKRNYINAKRLCYRDIPVIIVSMIMFACINWGVDEDGRKSIVIHPDSNGQSQKYGIAGEKVTYQIKVKWEDQDDRKLSTRLILSILVPRSWRAAEIFDITYKDSRKEGTYRFELETDRPKNKPFTWADGLRNEYKAGQNQANTNGLEWVTYRTVETEYLDKVGSGTLDISATFTASQENLMYKPAFYVNYDDDGLSKDPAHCAYEDKFDCFEIREGAGREKIDYCEQHYNMVDPLSMDKNDFITIYYQGDIKVINDLDEAQSIHLIATAYTNNGSSYTVSEIDEKNKMTRLDENSRTYIIGFWPAEYFGIPEGEEIERIEYYYSNEDGIITQKEEVEDGPDVPFVKPFYCD